MSSFVSEGILSLHQTVTRHWTFKAFRLDSGVGPAQGEQPLPPPSRQNVQEPLWLLTLVHDKYHGALEGVQERARNSSVAFLEPPRVQVWLPRVVVWQQISFWFQLR